MNTTSKILTAFAVGAVTGAVLGVLFAPDKGSETRHKIGEEGKKMAESFKDKLRKTKEKFNDVKEDLKNAARETMNNFEES